MWVLQTHAHEIHPTPSIDKAFGIHELFCTHHTNSAQNLKHQSMLSVWRHSISNLSNKVEDIVIKAMWIYSFQMGCMRCTEYAYILYTIRIFFVCWFLFLYVKMNQHEKQQQSASISRINCWDHFGRNKVSFFFEDTSNTMIGSDFNNLFSIHFLLNECVLKKISFEMHACCFLSLQNSYSAMKYDTVFVDIYWERWKKPLEKRWEFDWIWKRLLKCHRNYMREREVFEIQ